MRRLYLHIYVAFIGILLLFALVMSLSWWLLPRESEGPLVLDGMAYLVSEALPSVSVPKGFSQSVLQEVARRFRADITVRTKDGALIGHVGQAIPAPPSNLKESRFLKMPGFGPVIALRLTDGRWVMVKSEHRHAPFAFLWALALLLLMTAGGAFFIVRRITGRLERLKSQVEALGRGDLSARVAIEGRDEIADVAKSFNNAAAHIEKLVGAHKAMLANVSHELRSPLTRMRMATELLSDKERPELLARMRSDVGELDTLIDELLESSRLDAGVPGGAREEVDLLGLLAEEAASVGAQVTGTSQLIVGDARLLRRMIRNLLENAKRYGGGTPIEGSVTRVESGEVQLSVKDRGPGITPADRQRIFEPFYRPQGARETGDGVGLGLALVKQIAHAHCASVEYRPREGGGSEFVVTFGGTPNDKLG